MRFCLFKPGRQTQLRALCLGSVTWLVLAFGCTGKPFTAGTPGAGGSAGALAGAGGEISNEAGESGSAEGGAGAVSSGGKGGEAPSAGSAGKPSVVCNCGSGEYCQDGTNKCRKCADFGRFEFADAQPLGALGQTPKTIERFARPAATGSALFYVSGALDNSKIMYTAVPVSGLGTPVSAAMQVESGPLFVNGFRDQNLFFDRREPGGRKLRMALWTAPAMLTKEVLAPEPINAQGSDDYSIAISSVTGHVYWMSTRNQEPELLWQPTSMSAPPAPAVLDLKVKAGSAECPRSGEDATPWVNADGTLLLFRNPSVDENCAPNDSGATDLFAVALDTDGTPHAAATALTSLNSTGGTSIETDPTLSNDACTIYFASDNGSGNFDLYRASRN